MLISGKFIYKNIWKKIFGFVNPATLKIFASVNNDCRKVTKDYKEFMHGNLISLISICDDLELFKKCRFEMHPEILDHVVINNAYSILNYLFSNKKKQNVKYCNIAAAFGQKRCLMYLHTNGFKWNTSTCETAAANGHLECLKLLRTNGCSWNEKTCLAAISGGHIDCLKYAVNNGCVLKRSKVFYGYKGALKNTKIINESYKKSKMRITYHKPTKNHWECLKYCEKNNIIINYNYREHRDCVPDNKSLMMMIVSISDTKNYNDTEIHDVEIPCELFCVLFFFIIKYFF